MTVEKLMPMRAVCAMYGLNSNTLRTWERRYRLVNPQRTKGGQRVYSGKDVAAIDMMVRLTRSGVVPAEAAGRTIKEILTAGPARAGGSEERRSFAKSARRLNFVDMTAACNKAERAHGYQAAVEKVMFPALAQLGHDWETAGKGVAVEHLATFVVREFLSARLAKLLAHADGPAVTMACVPEEEHDLALIHLANLLGEMRKCRPLLLISGLPLSEVLDSADQTRSALVVLSGTIEPRSSVTRAWMDEAAKRNWADRLILGGPAFARSRIFSELPVKSIPENFTQAAAAILRLAQDLA